MAVPRGLCLKDYPGEDRRRRGKYHFLPGRMCRGRRARWGGGGEIKNNRGVPPHGSMIDSSAATHGCTGARNSARLSGQSFDCLVLALQLNAVAAGASDDDALDFAAILHKLDSRTSLSIGLGNGLGTRLRLTPTGEHWLEDWLCFWLRYHSGFGGNGWAIIEEAIHTTLCRRYWRVEGSWCG